MSLIKKVCERNTEGLKQAALNKSNAARKRADMAIDRLVRAGKPVNFQSVHLAGEVSVAFLYGEAKLRARIQHLRGQHKPREIIPTSEQANANSLRTMVAALKVDNKRLRSENSELRKQLEVAYDMRNTT